MMRNRFSALALVAALVSPVVISSTAQAQAGVELRIYDKNHKDYHNWNADEDKTYRAYLNDNHRKYRDFKRQSAAQQRAYWQWRHTHGG
jgi:hypothetical protein